MTPQSTPPLPEQSLQPLYLAVSSIIAYATVCTRPWLDRSPKHLQIGLALACS